LVNAAIITIEVNIIQGASFCMVGLPDSAVKESQFQSESILKSNIFRMTGQTKIEPTVVDNWNEFFEIFTGSFFVLMVQNL
jgi:hypothetical protein